jgi:vesicle coat complex subunit
VIIAKDIFRRFPNKYEKIIGDIVAKLSMFTEPEAKSAMVWILGEYAQKIKQSAEHIKGYVEDFLQEPIQV